MVKAVVSQSMLSNSYTTVRELMISVFGDCVYTSMIKGVETSHCLDSGKSEVELFIINAWHAIGLKGVHFGQKQHFLQQK